MSGAPSLRIMAGESLVVLTRDAALARMLAALGSEHGVHVAGAESELAATLLEGQTGVAIVDAGAVSSPIQTVTERLKAQFPELVLIVAGRLEDQNMLSGQITAGTVYRFLHKPVSEQRVRLFVDAAWRRHAQERSGPGDFAAGPIAEPAERAALPRYGLMGGAVVLAVLAAFGGWLMTRKPQEPSAPSAATPSRASPATPARDEELESLLGRADQALAAGALVTPPAQNAADLYREALSRDSADPRPANGLEKVIDRLAAAAETQLAAHHLEEAQKLIEQARVLKPDDVRVAFLAARIGKEHERAVRAQAARQAASGGSPEQAVAAPDGVPHEDDFSLPVAEAGEETERLISEARRSLAAGDADQAQRWIDAAAQSGASPNDIADLTRAAQNIQATAKADSMAHLVQLFNQRLTQGRIVEPQSDSAKLYLAQLMQADPAHPSTVLARQSLAARTVEEAKAAIRRQDFAGAQRWLVEAREAGVDDAAIGGLQNDITNAQEDRKRENEVVPAGALSLTRYTPPVFPIAARERGVSGWVEVQFLVKSDGSVSDVTITGAEPAGMFEQAATEAVRKWQYQPVQRDGHAVEQHARLRLKFALENR